MMANDETSPAPQGSTASTPGAADSLRGQAEAGAQKAGTLIDDLKNQAGQLAGKAGSQLRDAATMGKDKAADGAHALADATRSATAKFDVHGKAEEYANRAAAGLDDFSETLHNKTLDDILEDAKSFAREHPVATAGIAALAAFALARFLTPGNRDRHED
ncbi:MAG: hypothetical protein WCZ66_06540 [Sphingomonadaceae bacterium]